MLLLRLCMAGVSTILPPYIMPNGTGSTALMPIASLPPQNKSTVITEQLQKSVLLHSELQTSGSFVLNFKSQLFYDPIRPGRVEPGCILLHPEMQTMAVLF